MERSQGTGSGIAVCISVHAHRVWPSSESTSERVVSAGLGVWASLDTAPFWPTIGRSCRGVSSAPGWRKGPAQGTTSRPSFLLLWVQRRRTPEAKHASLSKHVVWDIAGYTTDVTLDIDRNMIHVTWAIDSYKIFQCVRIPESHTVVALGVRHRSSL